jgi:hypothetical protein
MGEYSRRKGRYEVVRQLPEAGNAFQYRIQSETDGHERSGRPDRAPVIRIGYGKPEGEWRAAPKKAMGFERALPRQELLLEKPVTRRQASSIVSLSSPIRSAVPRFSLAK